mmetsp:Transcript_30873/g.64707  ORF Transcript_30873/g.64707 Transcript_30873/m.64707 type:complete len:204 (-) Transcript_30873:480-1091(-)
MLSAWNTAFSRSTCVVHASSQSSTCSSLLRRKSAVRAMTTLRSPSFSSTWRRVSSCCGRESGSPYFLAPYAAAILSISALDRSPEKNTMKTDLESDSEEPLAEADSSISLWRRSMLPLVLRKRVRLKSLTFAVGRHPATYPSMLFDFCTASPLSRTSFAVRDLSSTLDDPLAEGETVNDLLSCCLSHLEASRSTLLCSSNSTL